jgi:hypothetical protein
MVTANAKAVRLIGLLVIIAGAVLIVGGAATWTLVRQQLVAENITIPDDAMAFQGNRVDGPLDAYVQADIINEHALRATDGRTFAEMERDDPDRQVAMNASFLRSSLFGSIIAFGVAAFAAGVGVLMILIGWALRKTVVVEPAETPPAEPDTA